MWPDERPQFAVLLNALKIDPLKELPLQNAGVSLIYLYGSELDTLSRRGSDGAN